MLTEDCRVLATGSEGRGALGGRGIVVVVVVAIAGGGTDATLRADVSVSIWQSVSLFVDPAPAEDKMPG